jgi:hypothetical protein
MDSSTDWVRGRAERRVSKPFSGVRRPAYRIRRCLEGWFRRRGGGPAMRRSGMPQGIFSILRRRVSGASRSRRSVIAPVGTTTTSAARLDGRGSRLATGTDSLC